MRAFLILAALTLTAHAMAATLLNTGGGALLNVGGGQLLDVGSGGGLPYCIWGVDKWGATTCVWGP